MIYLNVHNLYKLAYSTHLLGCIQAKIVVVKFIVVDNTEEISCSIFDNLNDLGWGEGVASVFEIYGGYVAHMGLFS